MQLIKNILSVSKYESKLLLRSWFFKVFSVLAFLFFGLITFIQFLSENPESSMDTIPSLMPYMVSLMLNLAQAIITVFLASEYLKRDKELDTSEVFYVRPLSNAEYLFGKMWGTIRVFFGLDFIIMGTMLVISYFKLGAATDYMSYLWYFLILIVPTLIFITGLSTVLMMTLKSQALTFVILLGYIGITLFYASDVLYYLFDYIGFSFPMFKSTITGFAALPQLLNHRMAYLLIGLGCIMGSIALFGRLANSHRSKYPWIVLSIVCILAGIGAGFKHVNDYLQKNNYQKSIIALNNKHVNDPKMVIDSCFLDIQQQEANLNVKVSMICVPLKTASKYTFTLNPGMEVNSILSEGKKLSFERTEHLIIVDFGKQIAEGDTTSLQINYEGIVDERICYLDIPEELQVTNDKVLLMKIDKRYAYQTANYVLLTPETYWYPKPGVCYSDESPDWQQNYFTHYSMRVKPNQGLTVFSQGKREVQDSVTYFKPDQPIQSLSLCIGEYEYKSVNVDSTEYAIWYLKGHDFFSAPLDSIADTIPSLIRDMRTDFEVNLQLPYPFQRFALVEVPAQFETYSRAWTQAQETVQPEMIFLPEKGFRLNRFNFANQMKWRKQSRDRSGGGGGRGGRGGRGFQTQSDLDMQLDVLRGALRIMLEKTGNVAFEQGRFGQSTVTTEENPYYFLPEVYNFRYNVYSSKWPVANRLIEIFLQGSSDRNWWIRRETGLSNDEKALLMMQQKSFKQLLTEVEHRDLINNFIGIQGNMLFAEAQYKMGIQVFKDSLFNVVKANEFKNLSFESLLTKMSTISGVDLNAPLASWDKPSKLAEYQMGTPVVTFIQTDEKEIYQTEIVISNISKVPGYIKYGLEFHSSDGLGYSVDGLKPTTWIIPFNPHETKHIVSSWEEAPAEFDIYTMMATNLPLNVSLSAGNTLDGYSMIGDGEFVVDSNYLSVEGEIIVDNEDSKLFELSEPAPMGLLNKLINENLDDEDFKYHGFSEWRAPFNWTPTTDNGFFGKAIRSAYVIRSGDGSQYATWHVPLDGPGTYDVYYYVRRPEQMRWNMEVSVSGGRGGRGGDRGGRGGQGGRDDQSYVFSINYDGTKEETLLDLRRADDGWQELGSYTFYCDTVDVVLSNKTKLSTVTADAVKFVKR
ncbi:MAG: xanthan lyase [Bacteroidales bacterium]|nr:xanthan lyase [Bacteroidales bacterium]